MSVENYIVRGKTEEDDLLEELEEGDLQPVKAVDPAEQRLEAAGITAETIGKYLHIFKGSSRELADLTDDGINTIARCAGVSIDQVEIVTNNDQFLIVKATAINQEGLKHVDIVQEEKFRSGQPSSSAIGDAVNKAQRNAKAGLLPMTYLEHLMKQATSGLRTVGEEMRYQDVEQIHRDLRAEIHRLKTQVKRLAEENTRLRGEWEEA